MRAMVIPREITTAARRIVLAAMLALTVAAGLGVAPGTSVHGVEARGYTTEYYWQQGPGTLTAFYKFRSDGVGLRTTYPTGRLSYGQSFAFAWYITKKNVVVMTYASGYTDMFRVTSYNKRTDTLFQIGSLQGPAPLYGCRSGLMPATIYYSVC